MQRILILLILLPCVAGAQAISQKELEKHRERVAASASKNTALRSLDTIYNAGKPYAILKEKKKESVSSFTLMSLTGELLAEIPVLCKKPEEDCYFAFIFPKWSSRAEVDEFGNKAEKIIIERGLIVNNKLDSAAVQRFVLRYPPTKSGAPAPVTTEAGVMRATKESEIGHEDEVPLKGQEVSHTTLIAAGNEIKQANKTIATFSTSTHADDGEILRIFTYYNSAGVKTGEATQQETNSRTYRIVTFTDRRNHNVTVNLRGKEAEELAQFLLSNNYL
jgi:hypothetical protein